MKRNNYPAITTIENAIYAVMDEYKAVYTGFLYHQEVEFYIDYVLTDEEYYADEEFYKELKAEERELKDLCQYDMDKLNSAYQELRVAYIDMSEYYELDGAIYEFDDESLDIIYDRIVTDADIEDFLKNSEYWTMK